jgi:hypothetical protein
MLKFNFDSGFFYFPYIRKGRAQSVLRLGYWLDVSGIVVTFLTGVRRLFSKESRTALGPNPGTHSMRIWDFSPGLKWPGCEAGYSPVYSVEVKNEWSHTSTFL